VSEPTDIHAAPPAATHKPALFDHEELATRLFWTVPESAFMCRLSTRTVWRLMANPRSGFPEPRRVLGRTLLAAAGVMAFMEGTE
jgi:predicted DNA-binding transcriptional regulator AlpA